MQFRLSEKFNEADDVVTFVWEPEEPLSWQGGQFIRYNLPHDKPDDRGSRRFFTVAAPPYEGKPRITTRFAAEHSSSFKEHLKQLNVGDTIEAGRPSGNFVAGSEDRPLVLVAGGIGITPFRAILLQLDHDGRNIRGRLLYANRSGQYVFQEELEALAARHADFTINYFTDPKHIGVHDILEAGRAFPDPLYYLSGPEPMVERYHDELSGNGIPEDALQADYFPGYE